MSLLTSFTDFFFPSEEVSRQRRVDVFGTDSKAVAGTVIAGGAALAIAAPIAIAAGGLEAAGSAIADLSLGQKVILGTGAAIAAPVIAGAVINDPKVATRALGSATQSAGSFESNLYKLGKEPSLENVEQIYKDDPVIAGGLTALGAIAAGKAATGIIATVANTRAVKANTEAMIGPSAGPASSPAQLQGPISVTTPLAGGPQQQPLTPETQVLGKEVQSRSSAGSPSRRRKPNARSPVVRVNVINQQTYIGPHSRNDYVEAD